MALNQVIGQERVLNALQKSLQSGRIAHAYLFHGPDGVGKRAAAFALAKALQCISPVDGDACGGCNPCQKAQKGLHPDIHVLMPVTNDATHEDISARLQAMASDPYATVDFQRRPSMDKSGGSSNKQISYKVETVHELLIRPMSFHRVEGKYRVAILIDADKFRKEAANAFLKLLEEPGDNTVFILTTDRVDHLLPTILSRCQQMRFDTLHVDDIARALVDREYASPKVAAVLARMADGSLSKAMELAGSEELPLVREEVIEYLRASYKGKGDIVTALVDQMSSKGREHVKFLLLVTLGILRDLMLISKAESPDLIVNVDQHKVLSDFAENLPDARIADMIEAIETTSYLIERNVNARLALVSLSRVLSAAMRGKPSSGVITSLTA